MSDDNSPLALLANGGDKDAAEDVLDEAIKRFESTRTTLDPKRTDTKATLREVQEHARALAAALEEADRRAIALARVLGDFENLLWTNADISTVFAGLDDYAEFREQLEARPDHSILKQHLAHLGDDHSDLGIVKGGRPSNFVGVAAARTAAWAWEKVHGEAPPTTKDEPYELFLKSWLNYLNDVFSLKMPTDREGDVKGWEHLSRQAKKPRDFEL